ncbi:MAG: nucleotidyltransferase domain-containing protein [Candidatus Aenigmarchaeota archaeon]|nr:nucleotidyltransferase domain-containing protein [Candidatus Aenigmarchaeota archaeon]
MIEKMFSRVGFRILLAISKRPYEEYYLNKLSKELGVGLGRTSELLQQFERNRLLTRRSDGNRIVYRLNKNNPFTFRLIELSNMDRLFSLPERFRTSVSRLKDTYKEILRDNLVSVVVFGSVSKGSATKWSDIDILVIVEQEVQKQTADELKEAEHEISDVFSEMSQVFLQTKKQFTDNYEIGDDFLINIMQDGIVVFDKDSFFAYYLLNGIPQVTKKSIRMRLRFADERLKEAREMYRKFPDSSPSFLSTIAIHLCRAVLLLNNIIPGSKHDIPSQLRQIGETKLSSAYKVTRKWWDEGVLDVTRPEIEKVLNLFEQKYKEASKRLEDWK